jgi:hypothetical protein
MLAIIIPPAAVYVVVTIIPQFYEEYNSTLPVFKKYFVRLSIICDTFFKKIFQKPVWREPIEGSHREIVIFPVINSQLTVKIVNRVEAVTIIKAFVVLTV